MPCLCQAARCGFGSAASFLGMVALFNLVETEFYLLFDAMQERGMGMQKRGDHGHAHHDHSSSDHDHVNLSHDDAAGDTPGG